MKQPALWGGNVAALGAFSDYHPPISVVYGSGLSGQSEDLGVAGLGRTDGGRLFLASVSSGNPTRGVHLL